MTETFVAVRDLNIQCPICQSYNIDWTGLDMDKTIHYYAQCENMHRFETTCGILRLNRYKQYLTKTQEVSQVRQHIENLKWSYQDD